MIASSDSAPTVVLAEPPPVSLRLPRAMAGKYLRKLIDKGAAIRRQRIRYVEDLEDVRAKKADWVQNYTDVLGELFTDTSIAEACNDWVGRVYPEYAETSLFVEQFYEEMDHRIRRLRTVLKKLAEMAEPVMPVSSLSAALAPGEDSGEAGSGDTPDGDAAAGAATAAQGAAPAPLAAEPLPPPVCGILVAHGEQLAAVAPVRVFLQELGVEMLSLDNPPQAGRQMLEAYEQGPEASFALLALTPEQAMALRKGIESGSESHCCAAVAFQLGYFVGRLGASRICVLCPGMSDSFQDSCGVTYLPLDHALGWQLQLARHLRRAGIDIDLNRLC